MVSDEAALISALDTKQILSWSDFEYVLCLIIENRVLKLYLAYLEKIYKESWQEVDEMLCTASDQGPQVEHTDKSQAKKRKKRKNKKQKKVAVKTETQDSDSVLGASL